MSLLDIAKKRYSVRKYEDKPVEKRKVRKKYLLVLMLHQLRRIYSRLNC